METGSAHRVVTTYDRVHRVLAEEIGVPEPAIRPHASFVGTMGLDSLEMASLILELEDEFELEIPDDEMQKIFTPQDVVRYVDSRSH